MLHLTQMTDDVVKINYTLAKLTYRELKDKVIRDSGMTEEAIYLFDSEGEREVELSPEKPVDDGYERWGTHPYPPFTQEMYEEHLEDIRLKVEKNKKSFVRHSTIIMTFEEAKKKYESNMNFKNLYRDSKPSSESYIDKKKKYEDYVKNEKIREKKETKNKKGAAWGIEQYSFIVEEDSEGKWILLDGFNRLFGAYYPNEEKELILKIYPTLSRDKYSKLIDNVNTWKRINTDYSSLFFDRGVKLSLHLKYQLDIRYIYEDYTKKYIRNIYNENRGSRPDFFNHFNSLNQTGNIVDNVEVALNYLEIKNDMPNKRIVNYRVVETHVFNVVGKIPCMKSASEIVRLLQDERFKKDLVKLDNYKVEGFAHNYFKKEVVPEIEVYIAERIQQLETVKTV